MSHDSEYFRLRAEEARTAARSKDPAQSAEVAGELALAYAALARRRDALADEPVNLPAVQLGQTR